MAEAPHEAGRVALRWWRGWPGWIGYVAAAWSLAYGLLGLYWALGGAGFPFGKNDPGAALSILGSVRAGVGAPVIAALGLAGVVAAVAMARTQRGGGVLRAALLGFAWVAAASLALVIPDYRVLVAVAYMPIVLIGAPFGWPQGVSIFDVFPWPVVNQFVCIGGGLLWAATAVAYGRRSRGACESCGRVRPVGQRLTRRQGGVGGPRTAVDGRHLQRQEPLRVGTNLRARPRVTVRAVSDVRSWPTAWPHTRRGLGIRAWRSIRHRQPRRFSCGSENTAGARVSFGLREREIARVAMLAAIGGRAPQLKVHVRGALNVGVSPEEIEETSIQTVPYAGFPTAINAMRVLKDVLEEIGREEESAEERR
jgi:carboxymuconolactone decarboxylase family protein